MWAGDVVGLQAVVGQRAQVLDAAVVAVEAPWAFCLLDIKLDTLKGTFYAYRHNIRYFAQLTFSPPKGHEGQE